MRKEFNDNLAFVISTSLAIVTTLCTYAENETAEQSKQMVQTAEE